MTNDSSAPIVAALRQLIATASPGARLPSTRALVERHRASPLTVQRALRTLTAEGAIESRPGAGTFVRAARVVRPADFGWQTAALGAPNAKSQPISTAMRTAPNDVIAWNSGYPDRELLPERLVRAAIARASRSDAALSRTPARGLPELQAWFATEVANATPSALTPPAANDVIVLPGSQSGLASIFRALAGHNRTVVMESPTYWGAILAAAQVGADVVPISSGPSGPDPAELERAFAETGARIFYAQPTYANPTGAQWSGEVRTAILDVAHRAGAFVVEDDWAHDLAISSDPVPLAAHDDAGHVVYLRSLTKSTSPALRVAAVIARGPARDRILGDRAADTLYVSGLLQAAALDVVTQPGWQTHLRVLRRQLGIRRDLMLECLAHHVPDAVVDHVPAGGLNLWLRLPAHVDVDELGAACERDGLLLAPGGEWFPTEARAPFVRLNFAGPDPARYDEGAQILGRALDALV